MQYNDEQLKVITAGISQLYEPFKHHMVVVGPGGSGKTTCVMAVVEEAIRLGQQVLMCAPTNKAVRVLYETAKSAGLDLSAIRFSTLHSALGLVMLPTEEDRRIAQCGDSIIGNFDVVVLDEGSMLGKYIAHNLFLPEIERPKTFAIIMGDDCQLFPVRERMSPVFSLNPMFFLKRVERYKGESEIAAMNTHLRGCITNDITFQYQPSRGEEGGIVTLQDRYFREKLVEAFGAATDEERKGMKALAWRNKTVDGHNRRIRAGIYGPDAHRFEVGERVIIGKAISKGNTVLASTDDEAVIVHIDHNKWIQHNPEGSDLGFEVEQLSLEIDGSYGRLLVNVIREEEQPRLNRELSKLAAAARETGRWKDFWDLKEMFHDIRYSYCITVHRSQGSTYNTVFVDAADIMSCAQRAERQRLMYVATSRPRSMLYINKPSLRA